MLPVNMTKNLTYDVISKRVASSFKTQKGVTNYVQHALLQQLRSNHRKFLLQKRINARFNHRLKREGLATEHS